MSRKRNKQKKKLTRKAPVRWTKDDCGGAGYHKSKHKKGNRKQQLDKVIQDELESS